MPISNADFVSLHSHTEFSRFDGLAKIDDFTLTAKLIGMRSLAISDHGNVGGWIKFHQSCKKKNKYKVPKDFPIHLYKGDHFSVEKIENNKGQVKELEISFKDGINPIFGCEYYLSRNHELTGKEGNPDGRKGNRHLLLLAKNQEGYKNLCALSQRSYTHGQYIDPRIDLNLLAEHSKGVIASSACLGSVINNNLYQGRYDQARKTAILLKDIFGEDFYLSVMFHGIDAEGSIIPDILRLGKELGILVCAENDSHYCRKDQAHSQEVLMAMSTSRCIKDPKRIHFPYKEFYLKSATDMYKVFGHCPEVITNTVSIAERVEDFLKTGGMRLPVFNIEEARPTATILNSQSDKAKKYLEEILAGTYASVGEIVSTDEEFEKDFAFMRELAIAGMQKFGWENHAKRVSQLKLELSDIRVAWESNRMNFATYFLIVWDAINFAKLKGILTGPGRGSGYASVVLRTLGITYGPFPEGMIWERFLGFSSLFFLSDKDLGIGNIDTIVLKSEENEDILEDRPVEEDAGGVDRY